MNQTNWLPGLVVLTGGLLIAALYLLLTGKKGPASAGAATTPRDGKQEDLDRRAQLLIEQLRELEQEKHHLDPERYASEKSRLELAAAQALRERDQSAQAPAAAQASAPMPAAPLGFFGRHPEWKGAIWGGGVVLFFAVLGFTLYASLKPRGENDSATGKNPNEMMGAAGGQQMASGPQQDPELEAAIARLKTEPENLDLAAAVAHELIRLERMDEAKAITLKALGVNPFLVESRIHLQVIRAAEGDDDARKELQRIADTAPDSYEATLFLGVMAMQRGDKAETLAQFERFAVEAPASEQPPQLLQGIAMLRKELGR